MLLDTCALLWLADDQEKLSARARALITGNAGRLFISSITAFEIALKHRRGAIRLPLEPVDWIAKALEQHGIWTSRLTGASRSDGPLCRVSTTTPQTA